MSDPSAVTFEWVCSEGGANTFAGRVENDGGRVTGTTPFVPKPEEADLYSDAQFEPLITLALIVAVPVVVRYVVELAKELKGREVAVIDLTGPIPQVRVLPVGRASEVVVKAADKSVTHFPPPTSAALRRTWSRC